jgi:hypothetical protein
MPSRELCRTCGYPKLNEVTCTACRRVRWVCHRTRSNPFEPGSCPDWHSACPYCANGSCDCRLVPVPDDDPIGRPDCPADSTPSMPEAPASPVALSRPGGVGTMSGLSGSANYLVSVVIAVRDLLAAYGKYSLFLEGETRPTEATFPMLEVESRLGHLERILNPLRLPWGSSELIVHRDRIDDLPGWEPAASYAHHRLKRRVYDIVGRWEIDEICDDGPSYSGPLRTIKPYVLSADDHQELTWVAITLLEAFEAPASPAPPPSGIKPGPPMGDQPADAPGSGASGSVEPVVLGGPDDKVFVWGQEKDPLPPSQYRVIKALVEASEKGKRLSKDALCLATKDHEGNTVEDPVGALDRLCRRDADWRDVIDMAGIPGRGYGLKDKPPTPTQRS